MPRPSRTTIRLLAHVVLVLGIATSQVAATQTSVLLVREAKLPAFFLMWFSTAWNLLLGLPLLIPSVRNSLQLVPKISGCALVLWVAPFYLLWAAANALYTQALNVLMASLVAALFSVTPALVAVLSVPILQRHLSPLTVMAVATAAGGVTLIAEPWQV
jgi:drug/metabolite transporter (DMT)-like permease